MRGVRLSAVMIALLSAQSGCRSDSGNDTAILDARATRLTDALARADSGTARNEPLARWILPAALSEISGLTLTTDGRLFAQEDESARIFEIDYRRGTIVKQFFVGKKGLRGDFEGLAEAGGRFFLLSSDGRLYEFREGEAGERVDYTLHDTHLGKECEFEGVAWDEAANALILSCKNVRKKQPRNTLVLYRYDLGDAATGLSELTVPWSEAIGANGWKELNPSDITVDPLSGNYVLVAGPQKALLALTPAGGVVFARPLEGRHPQAEGIAITRDGILILSDEAAKAAATITLYRWP